MTDQEKVLLRALCNFVMGRKSAEDAEVISNFLKETADADKPSTT